MGKHWARYKTVSLELGIPNITPLFAFPAGRWTLWVPACRGVTWDQDSLISTKQGWYGRALRKVTENNWRTERVSIDGWQGLILVTRWQWRVRRKNEERECIYLLFPLALGNAMGIGGETRRCPSYFQWPTVFSLGWAWCKMLVGTSRLKRFWWIPRTLTQRYWLASAKPSIRPPSKRNTLPYFFFPLPKIWARGLLQRGMCGVQDLFSLAWRLETFTLNWRVGDGDPIPRSKHVWMTACIIMDFRAIPRQSGKCHDAQIWAGYIWGFGGSNQRWSQERTREMQPAREQYKPYLWVLRPREACRNSAL